MKRIRLVVSDFHLGVGRRLADGSLNPMEDFVLDERFVDFIEYYSTGDFTNAEVELIINGDFFNLLQGKVDGDVPWNITEVIACRQMQDILDGHPLVFDALQAFAELPNKKLVFTVGNHDSGLAWPAVKKMLKERVGEQIEIYNRSYSFGGVHIEHGDRYEPVHYVDPRLPFLSKGLEAPILNLPWASYFFIRFVRLLKHHRVYIDKVKPFRNYLTWAAIYDFRFFFFTITRLIAFVIWTALFGKVGRKRFGLRSLYVIFFKSRAEPEQRAAAKILSKPDVHTVIFGHTHHPVYRQLLPGKEYFNTGCWNGNTQLDIERYGYQVQLTYAYLEWEDDRWLTTIRLWQGTQKPYMDFLG